MGIEIDWSFIAGLEGARITKGYVPDPDTSRSGVTIATGVDLGQRTQADIDKMDIRSELQDKLRPYVGLRGRAALDRLNQYPLLLTEDEAAAIDAAVHSAFAARLAKAYNDCLAVNTDLANFEDLPRAAQTVIASVAFQYGVNLKDRTPHFWAAVTRQDWSKAVAELRDFGDAYETRRHKEAELLVTVVA